jgi:hypothetical protein
VIFNRLWTGPSRCTCRGRSRGRWRFALMDPRLGPLDCAKRPESSRNPSLLLVNFRVLFVHHRRIGTACSKRHTGPAAVGATEAGTPKRRQGRPDTEKRSHTAGLWANVRAAVRIGAPHCLFQVTHGFEFRPAKQELGPRGFRAAQGWSRNLAYIAHIFYFAARWCEVMNGNSNWKPDRPDRDWSSRNKAVAIES